MHLLRHVSPVFPANVPQKERSPTRSTYALPCLNRVDITTLLDRMADLHNEMVSLIMCPLASNGFCDPVEMVWPQYRYILLPVLIVGGVRGCDRAIQGFPAPTVRAEQLPS